jgi:transposase
MFVLTIDIPAIPKETVRAARAVFSRKNFYIRVGEQFEFILKDIQQESMSDLPKTSRAGGALLLLTTFFQFVEGLTDLQAMDAVRTRIDWKYALHLPVNTLSFHESSLCEFRQKVIHDMVSQCEFQKIVDRLITLNPPYHQTGQNFEVLALLSSTCSINVMNWSLEAMDAALGALASHFPDWLRQVAQPHWYWRFNQLAPLPYPVPSMRQQELSMEKLGADIHHLLEEVQRSNSREIKELRELKTLRQIWERQFENEHTVMSAGGGNSIRIDCDTCRYGAG